MWIAMVGLPAGPAMAHVAMEPPGIIAGLQVPSVSLYETVDPGGHAIDPGGISCSDCLTAYVDDGYCPRCHIGYVDGRAYVSRIGYLLSKDAERIDPKTLACATCRAHVATPGWCDRCARGILGSLAVRDHADFNEIMQERQRLAEAVRLIPKCEFCAISCFTHGRCPKCKIAYGDRPLTAAAAK
jgi:hypothetical protein